MKGRHILDHAYNYHVDSVRWSVRLCRAAKAGSVRLLLRGAERKLSWSVWLLNFLHGIVIKPPQPGEWRKYLQTYSWSDFVEEKDAVRSSFQGLVGPPSRILWSVGSAAALAFFAYSMRPDSAILNWLIKNPAFGLASFGFSCVAVDQLSVGLFKLFIITLSHLRLWAANEAMNLDVRSC